jgi:hypothetical protein
MSWDGIYAKDRHYPIFEPGVEIFTSKKKYKSITVYKPYIVVKCIKTSQRINIWQVVIINDKGEEGNYATYRFQKTEGQLKMEERDKKINYIIND